MKKDLFQARLGWFWLNDFEIFHEAYDLTDKRVEDAFRQGMTHLIIFGNHSRWNFRPWQDKITAGIAAVVRSAHQRNMKVIDHHSASLLWHPDTPERLAGVYRNFSAWNMDPENYRGIVDYLLSPDLPLFDWLQKDGNNERVITGYGGYAFCYNNLDYRREYFKYLESIYATGVDGIMTDDIQYFGESCNCPVCRKKFAEKYNMELPGPGEWKNFFRRLDAPGGAEQLRFRADSTHEFHLAVKAHYEGLGLNLLRPNYSSMVLARDWTSINIETLPALDWFFIECCNGSIFRYSWPYWLMEQSQTVMQAEERNIPPMLMNYAGNQSDLLVSFAMARLTGSLFTNTTVGAAGPDETTLREFEKRYPQWCFHAKTIADIGVYLSRQAKDYGVGYEAGRMQSWVEYLVVANVPFFLVNSNWLEIPEKCRVLLLPDVRMMSDEEIDSVRKAAQRGCTVIIAGRCGDQRPDGTFRSADEYCRNWGWKHEDIPENSWREFRCGDGKILAVGDMFGRPGDPEHWREILADKYWLFSALEPPYTYESIILGGGRPQPGESLPYHGRYLEVKPAIEQLTALLRQQNIDPQFAVQDLPDLVLTRAAEYSGEGVAVHIANFAGSIDRMAGAPVTQDDRMPWPQHSGNAKFIFKRKLSQAQVVYVEKNGPELTVGYDPHRGVSIIEFPLDLLHDYAMILAK